VVQTSLKRQLPKLERLFPCPHRWLNAESLPYSADPFLDSSFWSPSKSTSDPSLLKSDLPDFPYNPRLPRNIDIEAELSRQNLYKTELCRSWIESASCKYGPKCQFAHGQHELRPVIRHPKYKTEICKTFHTNGTCPYGKRCRFVHNPAELRLNTDDDDDVNTVSAIRSEEEEEVRQLQERFKLTNLAPDPVFYPTSAQSNFNVLPAEVGNTSSGGVSKKGSSLPFFKKLRKEKF